MRTWITFISPINCSSHSFLCDKFVTLRETLMRAYFRLADQFEFHFPYGESFLHS